MVIMCNQHGNHMPSTWESCVINMGITAHGNHVYITWISHAQHMVIMCNQHGNHMPSTWESCMCTSHGSDQIRMMIPHGYYADM